MGAVQSMHGRRGSVGCPAVREEDDQGFGGDVGQRWAGLEGFGGKEEREMGPKKKRGARLRQIVSFSRKKKQRRRKRGREIERKGREEKRGGSAKII